MKYLTFSKLINHYNKSSIGVPWKTFLCFINCSVNWLFNWLFSVLNSLLGLFKVGFVLFFFLKFVKKKKCLDALSYYTTHIHLIPNPGQLC